ncbi:MAG: hypothetical protein JW769_04285 [Parachlamydiales bacterium]|nr:hypothetical protein [Parachlamydiales bacterium]
MKIFPLYCSAMILFSVVISDHVFCADSPPETYVNVIDRIEYEDVANITLSHFTLTNGIKFIYESTYADTRYLNNFLNLLSPGTEILFSTQKFKKGICICYWDKNNELWKWLRNIALHEISRESLPNIAHIEKISTGWFSSKWHLYLTDGSFWVIENEWKKNLSNWKRGDTIVVSKISFDNNESFSLLNINVSHSYFDPVWDKRYDFRKIQAKYISSSSKAK